MSTPAPHPTPALLNSLDAYVDARVEAALRRLGIGAQALGPRELRIARGVELQDLAAKSGLSDVTLSRLERGLIKRPKPDTLNRIARALQIPESEYRQAVAALIQRSA